MSFRISAVIVVVPLVLVPPGLSGCLPETVLASCASCGEIRTIHPREVRGDPSRGVVASGPIASQISLAGHRNPGTFVVYDVRVRMDRGGSRDIRVNELLDLAVGDRVEIRNGRLYKS